jgi:hypothetical protein
MELMDKNEFLKLIGDDNILGRLLQNVLGI